MTDLAYSGIDWHPFHTTLAAMADEEDMYGGEDHDRFEAEEFDQEYADGGIREDVSLDIMLVACFHCTMLIFLRGSPNSWTNTMDKIEWMYWMVRPRSQ